MLHILEQHGSAHRNEQRYVSGKNNPDLNFWFAGREYHVECKRVENLNISRAITQAETDAAPGNIPVVIHRTNRRPWYVTISLEHFLAIAGRSNEP